MAWLHVGFIDEIARRGQLLGIDARFSWAGFFAGNALVQRAGGAASMLWLVRFAPVALNLFACWGIALLGRLVGVRPHRRLLAGAVFLLVNWTGQDYFSPQGVTFGVALAAIVGCLAVFGSDPRARAPRLARWLRAAPMPSVEMRPVSRSLAYAGLLVGFVGLALSHQLSPLYVALVLLVLGFAGVIRVRWIGAVAAAITLGWVSFGATAYWKGHLGKITGSFGEVGTAVHSNVAGRTHGNGHARTLALASRLEVAALVWVVAVVVLFVLRRRGALPVPLLCVLLVPMPLFVAQSYGGEMLIRIYLFSLPAAALLVAQALDHRRLRSAGGRALVGLGLAALVPVFVLGRFGNERYEQVTDDDEAIIAATYEVTPPGSIVFVPNRQTVMYVRRVEEVRFRQLVDLEATAVVDQLRKETGRDRDGFVMLTNSEAAFGELVRHLPEGWIGDFRTSLMRTGQFTVVRQIGDATLLDYKEGRRR